MLIFRTDYKYTYNYIISEITICTSIPVKIIQFIRKTNTIKIILQKTVKCLENKTNCPHHIRRMQVNYCRDILTFPVCFSLLCALTSYYLEVTSSRYFQKLLAVTSYIQPHDISLIPTIWSGVNIRLLAGGEHCHRTGNTIYKCMRGPHKSTSPCWKLPRNWNFSAICYVN